MKTITPAEYQRLALKTERTPEYMRSKSSVLDDQQLARLDHAIKGLVTEAAELQDAMKRHLIYGEELDVVNLIEEIGDIEWYKALALSALDATAEQAMEANLRNTPPHTFFGRTE